jgi:hypothetical protein
VVAPRAKLTPPEYLGGVARHNALCARILVETERSAVPVAQHPLVVDFVARMQGAQRSSAR